MKHYSFFIQPGFRRVNTTDNDNNVHVSAYRSPDGFRLVTVLINTNANVSSQMNLNSGIFAAASSSVFQTVGTNTWQPLGALTNPVTLPPRSLTTIVLDKAVVVGIASNPIPANHGAAMR
jgi:O-glycosyl hydrolase